MSSGCFFIVSGSAACTGIIVLLLSLCVPSNSKGVFYMIGGFMLGVGGIFSIISGIGMCCENGNCEGSCCDCC